MERKGFKMLSVKNLCQSYKNGNEVYHTLKNVSFEIQKGEFVAIMGPSGSGKSTLLNCISSFIPYDSGKITLDGINLTNLAEKEIAEVRNKRLGFVFQDFMLLDGLTVFENVCVPKVIQESPYKPMEAKAKKLLQMFDIERIAKKYPAEISGGQRQRTAVARSLMNDPLIILADEPTGNLDSRSSEAVIQAFIEAKKQLQATIFMVTHDSISASYCDRVIVMKDGQIHKEMKNRGNRKVFLDQLLNIFKDLNGGDGNDVD
ncbi:hypothetical protein C806_02366 [Lachnospiraceae bacterium 3-1]|nr:hypothetical protein C806_02366 [Lachnospiraceae bacterium 3-1]